MIGRLVRWFIEQLRKREPRPNVIDCKGEGEW